ncbi:MAG: hypothetical protein GY757_13255 [bacterium]|nr:hypothetical protein [bacterium]
MKNKPLKKKLTLNRETIANLEIETLKEIKGGIDRTTPTYCKSCMIPIAC